MASKLIRDNIPSIMKQNSCIPNTHYAAKDEFEAKLIQKLIEECDEFAKSHEKEELADILEVVYTLAQTQGLSQKDLEKIRLKKQKERGSFKEKIILDS